MLQNASVASMRSVQFCAYGLSQSLTSFGHRGCHHLSHINGGRCFPRISSKRFICAGALSDVFNADDDYSQLCITTSQALVDTLLKPVPQPEKINLVDLLQDVGDGLGYKVKVSQGRISLQARAGVGHRHAQLSLSHSIFDEKDCLILPRIRVKLPFRSNRQPDIAGWRKPMQLDLAASEVEQRPDWVCEILSPSNKVDDLPGGDKFKDYEGSRIPYDWIVDPATGQILVYELRVDEYMHIPKATFKLDKACVLDPFRRYIDLEAIFWFLVQKQK